MDLVGLVDEVAELVRREAEVHEVELTLELADDLAKPIGTRSRLQQLLLTLTLNAIAVTPAGGGVRIRARNEFAVADAGASELEQDGPETVCIELTDQGPGFAPAELEQLFDPLRTAPSGTDRNPDASARAIDLGLVVAHEIVREHGGAVSARSVLGDGATFEIRLPADSDTEMPTA